MKNYKVLFTFSEEFEVSANNEVEAESKAHAMFISGFNCVPMPDDVEIECLDDNEEDEAVD